MKLCICVKNNNNWCIVKRMDESIGFLETLCGKIIFYPYKFEKTISNCEKCYQHSFDKKE